MSGRFELKQDEHTGRKFWWGAESEWKDATEVGENGTLTMHVDHFPVGTVLTFTDNLTDEQPTRVTTSLLNCPFCGGRASFGTVRISSPSPITNKDGSPRTQSVYVNCQHCQANINGIVHGYQTQAEAAEAWNTRKG